MATILVNKKVEYDTSGGPVVVAAKPKVYEIVKYYMPPRGTSLPPGHILVGTSTGDKWEARVNKEKSLSDGKNTKIADYVSVR